MEGNLDISTLIRLAEQLRHTLIQWAPDVLAALAIFILGWIAARLLRAGIRRVAKRTDLDPTLASFLSHLLYMAAMALVVIFALEALGVNTTSFAAVIAAAGLAIGLALQGSLSNFASGALLIFFRPFKVGDLVEVGGTTGKVEEIQVFQTVLKTPDNKIIIVPNSAITESEIVNHSAKDTRRIDLVIGIGYDDDIPKARQIFQEALAAEERVLETPKPQIVVLELGDSSVNFGVRPWVKTGHYWPVRFALIERIKIALDEAGISIPYPQRDVHLYPAGADQGAADQARAA